MMCMAPFVTRSHAGRVRARVPGGGRGIVRQISLTKRVAPTGLKVQTWTPLITASFSRRDHTRQNTPFTHYNIGSKD